MNKEKVSVIAVSTNILLAFLKITAGLVSGSTAVLAEGLHSAVDIVSSGLSFIGIRAANKPADKEHPYGHFKFEVLSGLIITLLLLLTGFRILYESYLGFVHPVEKEIGYLPLGVMAFSAVINEVMARLKIHIGTKERSLSLVSDGVHSRVDAVSSLAVFAGLFLTPLSPYSDPALTLLVGIYIIRISVKLGKEAVDSLMDASAGEEIERIMKEVVLKQKIEIADLKTQKKGSAVTANLIIKLPKTLNVAEAGAITSDLQRKLREEIPNLQYIAIQISSHDIENSYYQPTGIMQGIHSRQGFGWQRQGRFSETMVDANGKGPGGACLCEKCGSIMEHQKGVPCSALKCLKCGGTMVRSDAKSDAKRAPSGEQHVKEEK